MNIIKKNLESGRKRRGADANPKRIKSLQQILDEFKNTRDEIQSNFEWKYYNITGLDVTPTAQTTAPEVYNTTVIEANESTTIPSTHCNCQLGVILTACSFGALFIIAYAIYKSVKYIKREK